MRIAVHFTLLLLMPMLTYAQVSVKDSSVAAPLISVSYAVQFPQLDMASRFGANSNIGGSVLYKNRGNWLYGVEGTFLFGNKVKDTTMLDALKTQQGFIIDQNGLFADILIFERGFTVSGKVGKMFPVLGPNPNSGFLFLFGVGLLQHKLRFDVEANSAPQLQGDYKKGYDRLTNGLALSEFAGYQYLGNHRLVNFFIGVEYIQAFTQSRRSYDFDKMSKDETKRNDHLFGFRAGWTLPLYKKVPDEFYYN